MALSYEKGLQSGVEGFRCAQVTVSVQVENSRKLCSSVAKGEVDAALIGGEVPIEIRHVLSVSYLFRSTHRKGAILHAVCKSSMSISV